MIHTLRTLTIDESSPKTFDLSADEADTLRQLGKALASKRALRPMGELPLEDEEEEEDEPRYEPTKLTVTMESEGRYTVRVNEAVGVVATESLQLVVGPKIPLDHLLFLLERGKHVPDLDRTRANLANTSDLWSLLVTWLVSEVERVVSLDLIRDYNELVDDLRSVRGALLPLPTARHYYAGRLMVRCAYEEFNVNTPLNRLLKAGVMRALSSPTVHTDVRRRARRLIALMEEVEELLPFDLAAEPDRRTRHYGSAVMLAKQVIAGAGRTILEGGAVAWTFLIRTPEMVEDGLRSLLQQRLGDDRVYKRPMQLGGTRMKVDPDLIFKNPDAVGDVKYKVSKGGWYRPDLYQVVAFAEAHAVDRSVIVRFRKPSTRQLRPIQFGKTGVREITWDADESKDPHVCAEEVVSEVEAWLASGSP